MAEFGAGITCLCLTLFATPSYRHLSSRWCSCPLSQICHTVAPYKSSDGETRITTKHTCNPEDASRAGPRALMPQATYCDQPPESELHPPVLSSPSEHEHEHPRRSLQIQNIDIGGWSTQNPGVISPRLDERALGSGCNRNMSVDLEKQDFANSNRSSRSGSSKSTLDNEMCTHGQEEENEQFLEQNALKILVPSILSARSKACN